MFEDRNQGTGENGPKSNLRRLFPRAEWDKYPGLTEPDLENIEKIFQFLTLKTQEKGISFINHNN
jgi:hypothetical protein